MRTYSKIKLISILTLSIFIIGCSNAKDVGVYKTEYPVGIYDYSFSETGFLHKDFDNQWIAFYDFDKKLLCRFALWLGVPTITINVMQSKTTSDTSYTVISSMPLRRKAR